MDMTLRECLTADKEMTRQGSFTLARRVLSFLFPAVLLGYRELTFRLVSSRPHSSTNECECPDLSAVHMQMAPRSHHRLVMNKEIETLQDVFSCFEKITTSISRLVSSNREWSARLEIVGEEGR